jgi:hypothetical protein
MEALGARALTRSENKKITESLIKEMDSTAADVSRRPGHWWCDQLNNPTRRRVPAAGRRDLTDTAGASTPRSCRQHRASIHGVTWALWQRKRVEVTASSQRNGGARATQLPHRREASGSSHRCGTRLVNHIETVKRRDTARTGA